MARAGGTPWGGGDYLEGGVVLNPEDVSRLPSDPSCDVWQARYLKAPLLAAATVGNDWLGQRSATGGTPLGGTTRWLDTGRACSVEEWKSFCRHLFRERFHDAWTPDLADA